MLKKVMVLMMAVVFIVCLGACSSNTQKPADDKTAQEELLDEETANEERIPIDSLVEFNFPEAFENSAMQENEIDDKGRLLGIDMSNDDMTFSATVVKGGTDLNSFAQTTDKKLEKTTFGNNTIYIENFSKEVKEHQLTGYLECEKNIIQINFISNQDKFSEDDTKLIEQIITNMTIK